MRMPCDTIGGICARFAKSQAVEITLQELLSHIARGKSFTEAHLHGGKAEKYFVAQYILCVDVDNAKSDVPWCDIEQVKAICSEKGLSWAAMYYSFSHDPSGKAKFRLIFILNEPITDPKLAKEVKTVLIGLFPQADVSTKNLDRFFYGTNRSDHIVNDAAQFVTVEQILRWKPSPPTIPHPPTPPKTGGDDLKEMYRTFPFLEYMARQYPHCQQRQEAGKIRLTPHPHYPDDRDDDRGWVYDPASNTYKDFSRDGSSGNIFNFMTNDEGMTPQDTRDEVKRWNGIAPERDRKDYKNAKARERRKNTSGNTPPSGGDSLTSADEMAARGIIDAIGAENIVYSQNYFYTWGGKVWEKRDPAYMRNKIAKFCAGNPKLTGHFIGSVLKLLEAFLFKEIRFNSIKIGIRIPVLNGEVWRENDVWILKPHCRESYRTTLFSVSYDPDAQAPLCQKFLPEIFSCDEDGGEKLLLLLQMAALCFLGTAKYEVFFILTGQGCNGKGTFLEMIYEMLGGSINVGTVSPNKYHERFSLMNLVGKSANFIFDLDEDLTLDASTVKSISSGEPVTIEQKYKDAYSERIFCTQVFACNNLPRTNDFSNGVYRRLNVISFNMKFDENRDRDLKEKLRAEKNGIFNLILAAIDRMETDGCLIEPPSCIEAKKTWRKDIDQVSIFVDEECLLDSGARIPIGELYTAYS